MYIRMKISYYLKKHNLSRAAFAKKAGVIDKAVSHWITGERKPKPATALKIERVTKGEVTLQDIYS
jgi:DNA-binding transcriptional regulator YdaS (Cro superfamily)